MSVWHASKAWVDTLTPQVARLLGWGCLAEAPMDADRREKTHLTIAMPMARAWPSLPGRRRHRRRGAQQVAGWRQHQARRAAGAQAGGSRLQTLARLHLCVRGTRLSPCLTATEFAYASWTRSTCVIATASTVSPHCTTAAARSDCNRWFAVSRRVWRTSKAYCPRTSWSTVWVLREVAAEKSATFNTAS